jgi:hypothetical protein
MISRVLIQWRGSNMKRENVKQNINFLEYPLWFQDEVTAAKSEQGMTWKDREGFIYKAGYKTPVKTDAIFLLYLLMQSQKNGYNQELTLTRYQVLSDCGLDDSTKSYDRLEDSLKRWKMVGVEFSGTFYDGESYSTINFGVIDSWSIHEETKELKVLFSPSFIKMMLGKGFFKYINFAEFKKLRSPLATRLYEILCKSFHIRDTWEINAIKLAEKIPMKERFPAHIVPKIKTAIARINKCSDTNFLLETRKVDRGQTILCFRKTATAKDLQPGKKPEKASFTIPDNPEINALSNLLPEPRRSQKTILEPIIAYYKTHGTEYVARNIRYANENAKTSYRPYLIKALQHDCGLAMQEGEKAAQQIIAKKTEKARQAAQKEAEQQKLRKQQEENQKQAREYIKSLSEEARSDLQLEAIAGMTEQIRDRVLKKAPGSKIILSLEMEKIALQRLSETKTAQPSLEISAQA